MKIAVAKIGANITFSSSNKSAAMADIKYALRVLGIYENEVTCVTHRTRNTKLPKPLRFAEVRDIYDFNDYDCVLVFNGSINFFGGAEDENLIALYKALSRTTKRIFYVQTDGQLAFQNLWPLIFKREWANKYSEYDFIIDDNRITYLTQGRDLQKVTNSLHSRPTNIIPKKVIHYPWERTILMEHDRFFADKVPLLKDRVYDLGFGGATRNTHKRKKIEKYYNSPKLETLLFGNLRGVSTPNTPHCSKVSYQSVIPLMQSCKATVIVGDEFYNDNFHTLRIYEAILAGCLVILDFDFDPQCKVYDSVRHTLTVNSVAEVEHLINMSEDTLQDLVDTLRNGILEDWCDVAERRRLNKLIKDNL